MEVTPLMIYAIGILDSVRSGLLTAMILCIPVGIVTIIVADTFAECGDTSSVKKVLKVALICTCCFLLCGVLRMAAPSTNLAAAMYVLPAIANNKNLQAIGGNSLEALKRLTEQWLMELGDKKAPAHRHSAQEM